MANEDIKIIVGVLGDGSMSGESGKLIQQQLNSIAKQISSRDMPKIRVGVDFKATQEAFQRQLQNVVNSLKINAPVNLIANASKSAKSQATTAFSDFSGDTASVSNKAMSQKVALITQVDIAGKKYINTIRQQTEAEKKRAQAAKAADAEAAKASNDVIRASRERLQMDREIAAQEKKKISNEKAINAEVVATAKLNREKDQAIAKGELMLAQFPKMKKDREFFAKYNDTMSSVREGTITGKEADAQLNALSVSMKAAGLAGQTMGDKFKNAMSRFTQYVGASTIILTLLKSTKQMISNVVELDTSLVEFNKVADLTATQLEKITVEAFAMGESIGRTGKDVIDAATEFKRAGYDISESMDMARSALVMTNVGDGIEDTAEAASILIAALRGFEKPASEVSSIVDLINQVSNTSPIAFEDIAEGLTRVAGTMHLTGTSIEETVGLLTGGFSQLRNIEKVSSGLIMISQKLRGVDEDGTSVDGLAAKVADEFEAVGVSVEDTNGELRSTFDILKDYAAVYDELGSKQIQFLGEEAAGNRQVTVLNAIMQQWEDVEKAVSQATNSVGSAEKENAIFMDSIRGRLNELKSAWQELSASVIDSGFVKWVVTAGKDILNVITSLSDNLGVLPTALGLGGLVKLGANLGLTRRLLCVAKDGSHIGLPTYKLAA